MRILHTADWHIGKQLYKHDLEDQLLLFFDWLIETIAKENIDVLLVSGDVFDLANPSVKDRKTYYHFLSRLIGCKVKVIITGGNHDAVGVLNAPKEILETLDITVIGGATVPISDELIEIKHSNGEIALVVAAVPFLRDKDLRNANSEEQYPNRTSAIRAGIKQHYAELAKCCKERYKGIPVIAMGHLYVRSALTSESERDIHVGNTAAVEVSYFDPVFQYVALGHIHKPQKMSKNNMVRYSGSPIALSFSERDDPKQVLVLEIKEGKVQEPTSLPIPKSRALRRFKGPLAEIKQLLTDYNPVFPLPSLVEIDVQEEHYNPLITAETEALSELYSKDGTFIIVKPTTTFVHGAKNTADLFNAGQQITELKPIDVFKTLIPEEVYPHKERAEIIASFKQLLEEMQEEGQL